MAAHTTIHGESPESGRGEEERLLDQQDPPFHGDYSLPDRFDYYGPNTVCLARVTNLAPVRAWRRETSDWCVCADIVCGERQVRTGAAILGIGQELDQVPKYESETDGS